MHAACGNATGSIVHRAEHITPHTREPRSALCECHITQQWDSGDMLAGMDVTIPAALCTQPVEMLLEALCTAQSISLRILESPGVLSVSVVSHSNWTVPKHTAMGQ